MTRPGAYVPNPVDDRELKTVISMALHKNQADVADVAAHHGVLEGGRHFLQKPVSVLALTEKV